MIQEKSCGAVVFTRCGSKIQYVLLQNRAGIYGFPKGHVEAGETEEQTALREVFEEVGLSVRLVPGFRSEDEYPFPPKGYRSKKIVYFLAEYHDQELTYQKEELTNAFLADHETALALLQFYSSKRILTEADNFLCGRGTLPKP